MRCFYRESMHKCGNYLNVDIYPLWTDGKPKGSRRKKAKPTSEVQERLNRRNSERELIWLLNTNFTKKDIALHLSYKNSNLPGSDDEAIKNQRNFLRRLKRAFKREKIEFKYVAVAEKSDSGRYHHHLVVSGGIDITQIAELWGLGYIQAKPLQFNEFGIVGIAKYLVKKPIGAHRWSASRNLKKPAQSKRDGRISQKKVRELHRFDIDFKDFVHKQYPGYELADVSPYFNEVNGGYYIELRLYDPVIFKKQRRRSA